MDAARALADLTEISAHVEEAVIADAAGAPLASTLAADGRASALARAALDLLREAGEGAVGVEAATGRGSVFVTREGDRVAAAVSPAAAPSGLVLYDLRSCLRRLAAEEPKPAPRRRRKQGDGGAG